MPKQTVQTSAVTFGEFKSQLNATFDNMIVVAKDANGNRFDLTDNSSLLPTGDFVILASPKQMKGALIIK
jgi:hypothetical protein